MNRLPLLIHQVKPPLATEEARYGLFQEVAPSAHYEEARTENGPREGASALEA